MGSEPDVQLFIDREMAVCKLVVCGADVPYAVVFTVTSFYHA